MYQSLDAIDGKQARRTGSSGPLGELFDHGKTIRGAVHGALHSLMIHFGRVRRIKHNVGLSHMGLRYLSWPELVDRNFFVCKSWKLLFIYLGGVPYRSPVSWIL